MLDDLFIREDKRMMYIDTWYLVIHNIEIDTVSHRTHLRRHESLS